MFVRRKKNASGTTSVQVIEKKKGKNIVLSSIGSRSDAEALKELENKAKRFIQSKEKQIALDFITTSKDCLVLK